MTRYRAIDIIKNEIECVNRQDTCEHKCADCELVLPDIEIFEAYDMAIQALSSWEKYSDRLWKEAYERGKAEALSQELTEKAMTVDEMEREYEKSKALFHKIVECDDAVSRQAVLEQIRDEIAELPRELPTDARNMVRRTRVLDIIDRHMKGANK